MKLNKYEISAIIGNFINEEEGVSVSDLEEEGLDIDLLIENNLTLSDYEGNHAVYKDFKMRIIKKLYSELINQIEEV